MHSGKYLTVNVKESRFLIQREVHGEVPLSNLRDFIQAGEKLGHLRCEDIRITKFTGSVKCRDLSPGNSLGGFGCHLETRPNVIHGIFGVFLILQ